MISLWSDWRWPDSPGRVAVSGWVLALGIAFCSDPGNARDYNDLVVSTIERMPRGGVYGKYQRSRPGKEFGDLYRTVEELDAAIAPGLGGKLKVKPEKAAGFSFCSSATYLLFVEVLEHLQRSEGLRLLPEVVEELSEVGASRRVIHGELDGVGIFGHWNADGPGTAVLFERLGLGTNFTDFRRARPGDFLKIFWNDNIGKGERGHLVVFLGESRDDSAIRVWSSNTTNADGSSGYGTMWIEKSRIRRAIFSRLEHPANLNRWAGFSGEERKSDYLIRIRKTGSTEEEMRRVTGTVE